MSLNFNVSPYFDDFDSSKNFHRILFKPGVAVQARELTQSQTILQNQVTSFADNIFKQNSPVTGGQVTTNFNCYYIKLEPTYNGASIDVTQFNNLLVTNADGSVVARVIAVVQGTGTTGLGDPPTIIISYKSGIHFVDNDIIYDVNSNLAAQAISLYSSGLSSVASIAKGVFYVLGNFVQVSDSTVVLSKYSNNPSIRIGLTITETVYDYINDSSLLDPAIGASNYQAPGADRYLISLTLDTRNLLLGDDQNFIELVRVQDGNVYKMVDGSVYATIDDYFAKRDYETNGDYIVNNFKLTPKVNSSNSSTYILNVGKGLAYVRGYRVENPSPVELISDKARTTASITNDPVYTGYGSYFYVSNLRGANGSFFDVTTEQAIDLHCVAPSSVNVSSSITYNSTLVASGYTRGLTFSNASDTANANTFVYNLYTNDLQYATLSGNCISSTANTVTLPITLSAIDSAYNGVSISITNGTDYGDFKTIIAYNGSTRVATVDSNWAINPDTSSVFSLNFTSGDVESILTVNKASYPATLYGTAKIDNSGKVGGLSNGYSILENPGSPELLFTIGNPFVQSISSGSYVTTQEIRNVGFTSSGSTLSAQISYTGNYNGIITHIGPTTGNLPISQVLQQYTIVVTNAGTNTKIKVGDIIPWTTTANANRTVALSSGGITATFSTTTSDLSPFTATIVAKVFVENAVDTNQNAILKYKTLVTANSNTVNMAGTQINTYTFVDDSASSTGQIYIINAGIVSPGSKQSLYLSDVLKINKIIDTGSPSANATLAMLSNPNYDVTGNYIFDNGQRDSYYDHASITLRPGAPKPAGNLLVLVNYFKHSGGDGYFSVASYPTVVNGQDFYRQIPVYQAKSGTYYNLRDSLDFRPARLNAQTSFIFRYGNNNVSNYGVLLPIDSGLFTCNYSYYLGRKDLLVITKDRNIQIIEGTPSLSPILPNGPDGCLILANLLLNPYTGYLPTEIQNGIADLSIQPVQHRRYTMADIAGLDARLGQVEYYTSLSALEQSATGMQITDAFGLNRFKNGILTDDFSSFSTADTVNSDYNAAINKRTRQMSAPQTVQNFPLKNLALVYNDSSPSASLIASLNYKISKDGSINYFSLPYTSANLVVQQIASRVTNINPFSVSSSVGTISLTPNVDTWVDTKYAPSLLITDPSLQVFRQSNSINVLSVGDWQTISGTTYLSGSSSSSSSSTSYDLNHNWTVDRGFGLGVGTQTTTTTTSTTDTYTTVLQQQQNNILGPYSSINNTYSLNNGYITDVSVAAWIRPQEVAFRTTGLLFNSYVSNFFDNTNVDNYIRKPNIIELTNVSGTFNPFDIIGYPVSGGFISTAKILDVYPHPGTNNVRLYVAADGYSSLYTNGTVIYKGTFDASGNWILTSSTPQGTISVSQHFGGVVHSNANSATNMVQLSSVAPVVTNYYGTDSSNTIYILSGTGAGQSANIVSYNAASKMVTISPSIYTKYGDMYSIGKTKGTTITSFKVNEEGNYSGVFVIPNGQFHTGQRVFSVDNRINNDATTITTSAQSVFYAEGLQTTAQKLNFGASPAGAAGTFTQTNYQTVSFTTTSSSSSSSSSTSAWDPLAQTFIIDPTNYPNGAFLSSLKVFFSSAPTSDTSTVTLSIVGTLNGYPNGDVLDHSIVTLKPSQVNTSQNPQYLDSTTYTEFVFSAPVYIASGTLYAFILKSNSNEYKLWTAANGDTAIPSSVKNYPTDPTPTNITKITTAPYVGGLFISQNAQTWTADQNQSLMFVINRCVFDTTQNPLIRMVVPQMLPGRTLIEQSVNYLNNANSIANTVATYSANNVLVDAFNLTTTDFIPTATQINYGYQATLASSFAATGIQNINPGRYGTSIFDHIYLNDNNGERVLISNTSTSFSMYAQLSSTDDKVSPILSDAGSTVYTITYNINNCPLSNSLITIANGGSGYNVNTTSVSISSPTGKNGSQAYATANIANGSINRIDIIVPGSGYITTPTITITDANSSPGNGASVIITGETSVHGGPAATKYFTKKVVLAAGNDSGDLNVYLTAYRPVNTDILVYYKILSSSDPQTFESGYWQLMTKTQSSDTLYSTTRTDLHEYVFAPGVNGTDQGYISYVSTNGQTYYNFIQFAIKVVLVSTDNTSVPFLSDLRAIALPANVNTTS
jgi:hypothetical protein